MSDQELRRLHGECCAYCHGSGSDRTCPKTESEPWGAEDATTSFAAEEEQERAKLRAEGAAAERARIVAALRQTTPDALVWRMDDAGRGPFHTTRAALVLLISDLEAGRL